jgi:hypothetical protein
VREKAQLVSDCPLESSPAEEESLIIVIALLSLKRIPLSRHMKAVKRKMSCVAMGH